MDTLSRKKSRGQSLVEMVLITPLLLTILIAAFEGGMAMYTAGLASDAIRQPAAKKLLMAADDGTVTEGTVKGYANNGELKGNIMGGAALDNVTYAQTGPNDVASLLVGEKKFKSPVSWLPDFTFTVTQPIQKNLLKPANAGGAKPGGGGGNPGSAWVPGGTVPPSPGEVARSMGIDASSISFRPGCQMAPSGPNIVDAISTEISRDAKAYISNVPVAFETAVEDASLLQAANSFMAGCANDGAAACEQEAKDFERKDYPPEASGGPPPTTMRKKYVIDNPPGGPGLKITWYVVCEGEDPAQPNCIANAPFMEKLPFTSDPNHGAYNDESGQFTGPPAGMVDSCKARKQAECALTKAKDKVNALSNQFQSECQAFGP